MIRREYLIMELVEQIAGEGPGKAMAFKRSCLCSNFAPAIRGLVHRFPAPQLNRYTPA